MPSKTHGKICYLEIPTSDIERSVRFYSAVFGWKTRRRGDGSTAFDDSVGAVSGAWVKRAAALGEPGLLIYVMVAHIETTIEAIKAAGGRIVQPLGANAPELTARFADPDGNVLGLYEEPRKA